MENGARIYAETCYRCHGDGDQVAGVDLRRGRFRRATTDDDLVKLIRNGIPGTAMPANNLSAYDLAGVVAFLRSNRAADSTPIALGDDRKSFDCGDPSMNDFLQRYARQSHESGAAKTFLAIDNGDNKTILGFNSLAPGALAHADTPETVRRGLARHDVPGFRLARIATDVRWQGQGLGGQLLAAAARRCLRAPAQVGGVVLIIDAKNDRAARWYTNYGAVTLSNTPLTLVMSLAIFAADLKAAGQL